MTKHDHTKELQEFNTVVVDEIKQLQEEATKHIAEHAALIEKNKDDYKHSEEMLAIIKKFQKIYVPFNLFNRYQGGHFDGDDIEQDYKEIVWFVEYFCMTLQHNIMHEPNFCRDMIINHAPNSDSQVAIQRLMHKLLKVVVTLNRCAGMANTILKNDCCGDIRPALDELRPLLDTMVLHEITAYYFDEVTAADDIEWDTVYGIPPWDFDTLRIVGEPTIKSRMMTEEYILRHLYTPEMKLCDLGKKAEKEARMYVSWQDPYYIPDDTDIDELRSQCIWTTSDELQPA